MMKIADTIVHDKIFRMSSSYWDEKPSFRFMMLFEASSFDYCFLKFYVALFF